MRNIYRFNHTDCPSMDSVVIPTSDDGTFMDGWILTVGHDNKPELRQGTWKLDNPQLESLTFAEKSHV